MSCVRRLCSLPRHTAHRNVLLMGSAHVCCNNKYTQTHTSMVIETTTTIYHAYFVCQGYKSMGTKRLVCAVRGVKTDEFILSCKRTLRLRRKTIICTIPIHIRIQLRGAVCGGRIHIHLRSELYAYMYLLCLQDTQCMLHTYVSVFAIYCRWTVMC